MRSRWLVVMLALLVLPRSRLPDHHESLGRWEAAPVGGRVQPERARRDPGDRGPKRDRRLWRGLVERFYRSDYAYHMVSRMLERIPSELGQRPSELAVFTYLPFLWSRMGQRSFAHGRVDYGSLPGYCHPCSKRWRQRLRNPRLVVIGRHDQQTGRCGEGRVLVFTPGDDSVQRRLQEVIRLEGDETRVALSVGVE